MSQQKCQLPSSFTSLIPSFHTLSFCRLTSPLISAIDGHLCFTMLTWSYTHLHIRMYVSLPSSNTTSILLILYWLFKRWTFRFYYRSAHKLFMIYHCIVIFPHHCLSSALSLFSPLSTVHSCLFAYINCPLHYLLGVFLFYGRKVNFNCNFFLTAAFCWFSFLMSLVVVHPLRAFAWPLASLAKNFPLNVNTVHMYKWT